MYTSCHQAQRETMMIAYEHLGQKILHFWSVGDDCYMGDAPSQFLFTDSDPAFPGLHQALDEETFRTVIPVRKQKSRPDSRNLVACLLELVLSAN